MPGVRTNRSYCWEADGQQHALSLICVPGTDGRPYLFGREPARKPIHIASLFISATPVTQALWYHVMGQNPSAKSAPRCPVENVSWDDITRPCGFLERANELILPAVAADDPELRFRLPSETEWEYAARGGPAWRDNFAFSGSNDPDRVAWYGPRWTRARQVVVRLLGPGFGWRLAGRWPRRRRATETHDVALKAPNQLGLYDMSGNVWEWCRDVFTRDIESIPRDGSPCLGNGNERVLRGGCFHNWAVHCTVWKRYEMAHDYSDEAIGFRLVLSVASS
jgi:formylglycine-generating enzyme required for sulfatase activity